MPCISYLKFSRIDLSLCLYGVVQVSCLSVFVLSITGSLDFFCGTSAACFCGCFYSPAMREFSSYRKLLLHSY